MNLFPYNPGHVLVCPYRHASLYVDLTDDPNRPAEPIHLGIRGGRDVFFRFLDGLRAAGVHHVILNFKYGARDAAEVLEEVGKEVLPRLEASQLEEAMSPVA